MKEGVWVLMVAALLPILAVGAELALRAWIRRRGRYFVWQPGLRIQNRVDRGVLPELEPVARFEVNGDGERGGEVPRDRRGLYRVLVAGGSAVEGYLLDQATNWPGAVQRLLQEPERLRILGATAVHVGNIGRSGVGSHDLDIILQRVLPRYGHLDAILIMVGGSDVARWMEDGCPPDRAPSRSPMGQLFGCHPEGRYGWRLSRLALAEALRGARRRWLRPTTIHSNTGRWLADARRMRAQAAEVRTELPDASVMLDAFERHLRRVLSRAAVQADRVLLVRQPWFEKEYTAREVEHFWHGGMGKAWRERITVFYSLHVACRLMALMDARAVRVADALGIEHLDVRAAVEPGLETYYDFFHFTGRGARGVAEAVASALLHPSGGYAIGRRDSPDGLPGRTTAAAAAGASVAVTPATGAGAIPVAPVAPLAASPPASSAATVAPMGPKLNSLSNRRSRFGVRRMPP